MLLQKILANVFFNSRRSSMNGTSTAPVKNNNVDRVWWMLKLTYGIVPILAGLDKLGFDKITNWAQYLNPLAATMVPLSIVHILVAVGIVEIVAGLLVLTKWTRLGAYLVAAWLILIAINLVSMGRFYDIAIRDVVMAVGALALAMLTEIRERH